MKNIEKLASRLAITATKTTKRLSHSSPSKIFSSFIEDHPALSSRVRCAASAAAHTQLIFSECPAENHGRSLLSTRSTTAHAAARASRHARPRHRPDEKQKQKPDQTKSDRDLLCDRDWRRSSVASTRIC